MPLTTTLSAIRAHRLCESGWRKLLAHLGKTAADDEPLPFETILDSNGLDDALWCCRSAPQYDREWRLFAVWCARQVQHLMPYPRSVAALDVAERFAKGEATDDELTAAVVAAEAAWSAAWAAAGVAAGVAAEAAWAAAGVAAGVAAYDAGRAAAGAAAWAAAYDAGVAAYDTGRAAAYEAGRAAGRAAAYDAQATRFRLVCRGDTAWSETPRRRKHR